MLLSKGRTLTVAMDSNALTEVEVDWNALQISELRDQTGSKMCCCNRPLQVADGEADASRASVRKSPGRSHMVPIWKGMHTLPPWLSTDFQGNLWMGVVQETTLLSHTNL